MMHKSQFLIFALLSSAVLLNAEKVVVDSEADFKKLLDDKKTGVLKVSTEWCGACKAIKEQHDSLVSDPEVSEYVIAYADGDKARDLVQEEGVAGFPTFIYFAEGKVVDKQAGAGNPATHAQDVKAKLHGLKAAAGSASAESSAPAQQSPASEPSEHEGFLGKITGFIAMIFTKIKDILVGIVDWIKGLFGK